VLLLVLQERSGARSGGPIWRRRGAAMPLESAAGLLEERAMREKNRENEGWGVEFRSPGLI
jgi:hypothetical protein